MDEPNYIKQQLNMAADVQNYLLPKRIPRIEGYEMACYYQASAFVSGDYYDLIEVDERHLALVVADVSGKGVPAALVMAQVRALLRREALHSRSPQEVLIRLNRYLYSDTPRPMFVTMFYALLDIPKSMVTCAAAGHDPLILWVESAQKTAQVKPGGMALGMTDGVEFEDSLRTIKFTMLPGDRFVLYTDGVTEMMDVRGDLYGIERLSEVFGRASGTDPNGFVSALIKSLNEFRGEAPQNDDVTVVALGRTRESPAELAYIEGERFIRCPSCGAVNFKMYTSCRKCRHPFK